MYVPSWRHLHGSTSDFILQDIPRYQQQYHLVRTTPGLMSGLPSRCGLCSNIGFNLLSDLFLHLFLE